MSDIYPFTETLLGDLATLRRGITYKAVDLVDRDLGVPYVNMRSFLKGGGFNSDGLKYFNGMYREEDLVHDSDLLIANTDVTLDGDIVGIPAYLPDEIRSGLVLFSHHVTRLRLSGKVEALFLYYLLSTDPYRRWMHKYARGTTVLMLDMAAIKAIPIRYPDDKLIRKKVINILQTIDEAIEKTEALIEKYGQIKAGTMHDLFTRGLTPDGKLRPPRDQAPDLYQETPIGWIPKIWRHDELGNLLASTAYNLRSGPFGSALLKSELVEDGIPLLGIDNIHVEQFVTTYGRFVSENKFNELIKYAVKPRDVIITIMGTVGRSAVVPEEVGRALSSKHLWTMTLNQNVVIPELICWQLNFSSWVKASFRRETQGGIMDAIQSRTLRTLKLPVPPMPEQSLIFDRYNALSSVIRSESKRLLKLKLQRSGLMHDLLTGEVEVKIDEVEAALV